MTRVALPERLELPPPLTPSPASLIKHPDPRDASRGYLVYWNSYAASKVSELAYLLGSLIILSLLLLLLLLLL